MKIRYQTTEEFDQMISQVCPTRLQMIFPRDDEGIWDIHYDWNLKNSIARRNSVLAAFPLVGSIMGLTKLFSVWSVNLREDSIKKYLYTLLQD